MPNNFYSIDVSNNNFSGPINASIGGNSLTTLILSHNPLGGSIPKSLGEVNEYDEIRLQVLAMENCGLPGKIPVELGNATKLTTVLLSRNKLSGAIPGNLFNLSELKEFDVSKNIY